MRTKPTIAVDAERTAKTIQRSLDSISSTVAPKASAARSAQPATVSKEAVSKVDRNVKHLALQVKTGRVPADLATAVEEAIASGSSFVHANVAAASKK